MTQIHTNVLVSALLSLLALPLMGCGDSAEAGPEASSKSSKEGEVSVAAEDGAAKTEESRPPPSPPANWKKIAKRAGDTPLALYVPANGDTLEILRVDERDGRVEVGLLFTNPKGKGSNSTDVLVEPYNDEEEGPVEQAMLGLYAKDASRRKIETSGWGALGTVKEEERFGILLIDKDSGLRCSASVMFKPWMDAEEATSILTTICESLRREH